MATIYINISQEWDSAPGAGTISNPYTLNQWIMTLVPQTGDVYRIYGDRIYTGNLNPSTWNNSNEVSLQGWDGTLDDGPAPFCLSATGYIRNIGYNGGPFIRAIIDSTFFVYSTVTEQEWKNSYLYEESSLKFLGGGSGRVVRYLGCTIRTPSISMTSPSSLLQYAYFTDCFLQGTVTGDPGVTYTTITFTRCCFTMSESAFDAWAASTSHTVVKLNCTFSCSVISELPTTGPTIESIPDTFNFATSGLPVVTDSATVSEWVSGDYDTGFYGENRLGSGAWYFIAPNLSYKNLIIDSGAVYIDYGESGQRLLGATRGGNTFSLESEYSDLGVDGSAGPVKGGRLVSRSVPVLNVNLIEYSQEAFTFMLPGGSFVGTTYTRTEEVSESDYITNITLVGEVSGKTNPIIIIIKNALVTGNVDFGMVDNDEAVIQLQFTGHYLLTDLETEPYEIRYPNA